MKKRMEQGNGMEMEFTGSRRLGCRKEIQGRKLLLPRTIPTDSYHVQYEIQEGDILRG